MQPIGVPTHREELTSRERWRLRWAPALGRALVVALLFAGVGVSEVHRFAAVVDALPWHPWREHRWVYCGDHYGTFALYTRHPGSCRDAPFAPLDCAATCEISTTGTSWQCESLCPEERLARMYPYPRN